MSDRTARWVSSEPYVRSVLRIIAAFCFTRPVAFVLSGEMAFAYFLEHAPKGFWTAFNGGTESVVFCFLWLYFSVAGAGPWSLDAAVRTADRLPARPMPATRDRRPVARR